MIGVVASVLLGLVMCGAGGSKIAMGDRWPIEAQALGTPPRIAVVVPWFEIALGALLIVQVSPVIVGSIAAATLVIFSLLILRRLQQGDHPVCACFGQWSAQPLSWKHLARNTMFILLAILTILI